MALVYIVYAVDATGMNPDTERMNRVEEMPDDLARMWVDGGVARWPSPEEVTEYEATEQPAEEPAVEDAKTKTRRAARSEPEPEAA